MLNIPLPFPLKVFEPSYLNDKPPDESLDIKSQNKNFLIEP